MGRFKRSQFLVIVIYTLVHMFIISFISYDNKQTTYDLLSNQLFYDNMLVVSNAQGVNWKQKQYKGNYRVYVEVDEYCRAVMLEISDREPPMVWGSYPSGIGDGHKAVVGKKIYESKVKEEKGKKWITYLNQKFEVVGVVGADYITSCDDLIILFGLQFDQKSLEKKTIVIDAESPKCLDIIGDDLVKGNPEVEMMKGELKGTSRLTKNSYFYNLLYVEMLLLVGFTLVILGKYQHEKYKNVRRVYTMLGIPIMRVIVYEEMEAIMVNIISFIVAIVLGLGINLFEISQLEYTLRFCFIITFFSCVLILFFSLLESIYLYGNMVKTRNYK